MIDTPPIAEVLRSYYGPPPKVTGRREWWHCPSGEHADRNPRSFGPIPSDPKRAHCFVCDWRGDAIDLVQLVEGCDRAEAIAILHLPLMARPPRRPARPLVQGGPRPDWWLDAASSVVVRAAERLWSAMGARVVRYLVERRGLTEETIRGAGVGWSPRDHSIRAPGPRRGNLWVPAGIVIPWVSPDGITAVNFRRPRGTDPKYIQLEGSVRDTLYPDDTLRPGRPLILPEGEFDALLLGQLLPGCQVRTAGPASARLDSIRADTRSRMWTCHPWYLAFDADEAGESCATAWTSARTRRVKPPVTPPGTDWTDAWAQGADIADLWIDTLSRD